MLKYTIIITALTLCGCSSENKPQPQSDTRFLCDSGKEIQASFEHAHSLALFLEGETFWLNGQRTASGSKFSNGPLTFWNKGDRAILMIGDQTWQCHRR